MDAKRQSPILLGAATLMALSVGCDQPRPRCTVARGDFAASYRLISSKGNCDPPLAGEILSVSAYNGPHSSRDQAPDYAETRIAIQPAQLTAALARAAERAAPAPEDRPYALGDFLREEPDDSDLCGASDLSLARVRLPALPARANECSSEPAAPALDVSYTFEEVRVLVTPAALGTRLTANLTYQTPSCVAAYQVTAVYPAVPCGVPDPAVPAPARVPMPPGCSKPAPQPGPELPDDALCGPGSGLTPEFEVHCDPALHLCVLDGVESAP